MQLLLLLLPVPLGVLLAELSEMQTMLARLKASGRGPTALEEGQAIKLVVTAVQPIEWHAMQRKTKTIVQHCTM